MRHPFDGIFVAMRKVVDGIDLVFPGKAGHGCRVQLRSNDDPVALLKGPPVPESSLGSLVSTSYDKVGSMIAVDQE